MNKKVLGFYKKDGEDYRHFLAVDIHKLVPVNLKSESITLEELEKICNNFKGRFDINGKFDENITFLPLKFYFKKLLSAVRKEAKKENG